MSAKIIISGSNSQSHDETVRTTCIAGANGLLVSGDFSLQESGTFEDHLDYAVTQGAKIVVRSRTDIQNCIALAQSYFLEYGIMSFIPLHTNSHNHIILTPDSFPIGIIVCGAVLSAGQDCLTGYGNGLMITGIDSWFTPDAESSGVNGWLAGAIYRIMTECNCSAQEAWIKMYMTASHKDDWSINHGYGVPDVDAAIAYEIPVQENVQKSGLIMS